MSQATQNEFERLVDDYFQRHKAKLHLANPTFKRDGFIITAKMIGLGGWVELRCGPAEYNTEIFIHTLEDKKRWNLSGLLNIDAVRKWIMQNRPSISGRSRLEAEIDSAFCLLVGGLKDIAGFEWLYC